MVTGKAPTKWKQGKALRDGYQEILIGISDNSFSQDKTKDGDLQIRMNIVPMFGMWLRLSLDIVKYFNIQLFI